MKIEFFPDQKTVFEAMQVNDPLLMMVAFNRDKILISSADDSCEHYILLKQLNYPETDIDKYYRVVINQQGADWTFVCPSGYKAIADKETRIKHFFNDGIVSIMEAIREIGYNCEVNIPQRYRRHFNMLSE